MSLETLLEAAQYLEYRTEANARGEEPQDYHIYANSSHRNGHETNQQNSQFDSMVHSRDQGSISPSSLSPVSKSDVADICKGSFESRDKRRVLGAGTREVHNKLEKNRRAHLKECFELLKSQLPLNDRKASNLSILRCALRFIQSLKRKEKEYEQEFIRLRKDKIRASMRLNDLKNDFLVNRKHIDIDAILMQHEEFIPDNISNSTSTASECGMMSDTDDALELSPVCSPIPSRYITSVNDETVLVMPKSAAHPEIKTCTITNGKEKNFVTVNENFSTLPSVQNSTKKESARNGNEIKSENLLLKDLNETSKVKVDSDDGTIKRKINYNDETGATKLDLPAAPCNLQKLLIQSDRKATTCFMNDKCSVPSATSDSIIVSNSNCFTLTSVNSIPASVAKHTPAKHAPPKPPHSYYSNLQDVSGVTPVNNKKQIVSLTPMIIPGAVSTVSDGKLPIGPMTVGNIPSHITVLRTGGTAFTLPAQMLPSATLQLNGNSATNVFSPGQPALQLVAQPQNTAVKLIPATTAANLGTIIPPTITIMKPQSSNMPATITTSAPNVKMNSASVTSRQIGAGSVKHFPINVKIPGSSISSEQKNNASVSIIPTSSPGKLDQLNTNAKPLVTVAKTSNLGTQKSTSPLSTPPFTFTKFSIKQVGQSAVSPVNKSAGNLANQPQVSVMTMNSHPPGKSFTQILHQTLVQGIPSSGASNTQVNASGSHRISNISSSSNLHSSTSSVLSSQMTRLVPQAVSIPPMVPHGVAVVSQQNMMPSPGITQVTRVMPQGTPIMSSYAQQVTAPVAQIVATPVSVVSGTINANRPQIFTSQSMPGKLMTNQLPLRTVNQIPIIHQQYLHPSSVKPLVMVSNVIPQTLSNETALANKSTEKFKS